MKVIWVLENLDGNLNSHNRYVDSKLNTLLLLASVSLWKRNHPEDTCVLYTDEITVEKLIKLNATTLWDEIQPLPKSRRINKTVFWASAKLEVLQTINEPVILMDNDTHVYRPIKQYLEEDRVYVCNYEIGKGYYPTSIDPFISKLSYKTRWKTNSTNVSFLYLPDPKFTKLYSELSLQLMEELTALKAPHSQYLIFAEQLLLSHLLERENIDHSSIISTYWDCNAWDWGEDHEEGIWNFYESGTYFKHYGPLKSWILQSKADQDYETEILHLVNCINLPNLDLSSFNLR